MTLGVTDVGSRYGLDFGRGMFLMQVSDMRVPGFSSSNNALVARHNI